MISDILSAMHPRQKELKFAVIAVDAVVFRFHQGKLETLVGEVFAPEFSGKEGIVGGLIAPSETAEEALTRHLRDKAGINKLHAEQLYTFSAVDRDPRGRVVSVAYLCLASGEPREGGGDRETNFIPVGKAKGLAYDHDEVIKVALERLRAKLAYTNLAQHLLPSTFTLSELQALYETVLGHELDKRNFRKKVIKVGLVEPTGEKQGGVANRPAELYRFSKRSPQVIELL